MRCSDHNPRLTHRVRRQLVRFAAVALLAGSAYPHDLGIIGPVHPIAEPSLLQAILAQLQTAQSSGVLGQLQRDAQSRITRGIERPMAVATVSKTVRPRTHYYDPSITVPHAITDADGRILVAPGTTVNPLDTLTLSKHLLFFDARDAHQVNRAKTLLAQHGGKLKLILTGGSYLELMQQWRLPVFFDQQGQLTSQLRIQQVPALVYQEGRRLRIDEIL